MTQRMTDQSEATTAQAGFARLPSNNVKKLLSSSPIPQQIQMTATVPKAVQFLKIIKRTADRSVGWLEADKTAVARRVGPLSSNARRHSPAA